ncbi:1,6-anhydro-N-acetylmuramyl-L-alanine amidase AmpD [Salinisphaera sp. USBA-960]|nr:1,6-anhydro-N-acetylmuramyl-L-alanine amidase AmpD [Salifodinibacter halophilus]NNC25369.1 1,6-anhydro-N-acetylmuramyl-L-alanine amidase AmpD [Salifodinibacter halophilus]
MGASRVPAARWLASPNEDARPPSAVIDTIVVHGISLPAGVFGHDTVARLFTNRLPASNQASMIAAAAVQVSAHLFIDRLGRLVQFVDFERRAWHAGQSSFDGRSRVNDFSVGIELEGVDDCPYAPGQYRGLAWVCRWLQQRYPSITDQRIVSHAHIAPGRKTDPGPAFDWRWFFYELERR